MKHVATSASAVNPITSPQPNRRSICAPTLLWRLPYVHPPPVQVVSDGNSPSKHRFPPSMSKDRTLSPGRMQTGPTAQLIWHCKPQGCGCEQIPPSCPERSSDSCRHPAISDDSPVQHHRSTFLSDASDTRPQGRVYRYCHSHDEMRRRKGRFHGMYASADVETSNSRTLAPFSIAELNSRHLVDSKVPNHPPAAVHNVNSIPSP